MILKSGSAEPISEGSLAALPKTRSGSPGEIQWARLIHALGPPPGRSPPMKLGGGGLVTGREERVDAGERNLLSRTFAF